VAEALGQPALERERREARQEQHRRHHEPEPGRRCREQGAADGRADHEADLPRECGDGHVAADQARVGQIDHEGGLDRAV
jgi:hypothetical protein